MEDKLSPATEDVVVFLETAVRFLITNVFGVVVGKVAVATVPAAAAGVAGCGGGGGGIGVAADGELPLFPDRSFILICWFCWMFLVVVG